MPTPQHISPTPRKPHHGVRSWRSRHLGGTRRRGRIFGRFKKWFAPKLASFGPVFPKSNRIGKPWGQVSLLSDTSNIKASVEIIFPVQPGGHGPMKSGGGHHKLRRAYSTGFGGWQGIEGWGLKFCWAVFPHNCIQFMSTTG